MVKILKNKKILITAGSTWVPIDAVRVITNIFGGKLGFIIAKTAFNMGADVTLLLGAGRIMIDEKIQKEIKVIHFKYFNELLELIKKEVSSKKYDIVIHSAAVSDYTPVSVKKGKIKSGYNNLIIKLKPTVKIVDRIKKWDTSVFLVKFKLEVGLNENKLIGIAYKSMLQSHADLIIANDFKDISGNHKALIIDKNKKIIKCEGNENIARDLLFKIKEII